jgi:hypothetical protein
VRGVVLDDQAIGVANASVTVRVYRDGICGGPSTPGTFPVPATNGDGSFQWVLLMPLTDPFRGCLVIVAEPPAATGLEADSVGGVLIDFVREGQAPDTAVVDVVLNGP